MLLHSKCNHTGYHRSPCSAGYLLFISSAICSSEFRVIAGGDCRTDTFGDASSVGVSKSPCKNTGDSTPGVV